MTAIVTEGPVLLDIADGIARIRLNRPEASNAVDADLLRVLHGVVLRCHAEPGVRVVVLSGEGRNFCAGGDVKTFLGKGEGLPDYLREATAWLQLATAALIQLKAPVIAQVQGFAAGGAGFGFVCAADLVVAAEGSKFFSGAVRVGMAPDGGTTVTLARIVGLRRALDILLTNPTLTATEARDLGIVSRVVPDEELAAAVDALAADLAAQPPLGLAATKRLVWDGLGATVAERMPEEARVVSELSGTADSLEALSAVIERRPGVYRGH
ncbi:MULTISPECIES: enoyl-CoA hydratase/isomerase family protein [unclassified Nocardioides]|uniref:enoyl-CoA hydratase/isomerase family protein n=1 Tax=unclassified Nocardioides TaxID=2615069 RepID=UPI00070394B2|nr:MULTISPECIES: enoyl-CoA hydratase/isomerase family protein [unclassified Nocardioides]KRC54128.1 enoyl-CoA hydratase [Nocardioides sp. Root79]KRC71464.1 enoyl-CoA hydratase [Nocardioides sp. Root240]